MQTTEMTDDSAFALFEDPPGLLKKEIANESLNKDSGIFQDITMLIEKKAWPRDEFGQLKDIPIKILLKQILSAGNQFANSILECYVKSPKIFDAEKIFVEAVKTISKYDCQYPKKEVQDENIKELISIVSSTLGYSKKDAEDFVSISIRSKQGIAYLTKLVRLNHQTIEE